MDVRGDSRLGRRMRRQELIIGTGMRRLTRRVERVGRAVGADGPDVVLADGSRRRPDAVVWATGYRPAYPWLHVPVLDERGVPVHDEGVTNWPGLYFLGLPWQRDRGSAVLGWVGRDARAPAERLTISAGATGYADRPAIVAGTSARADHAWQSWQITHSAVVWGELGP